MNIDIGWPEKGGLLEGGRKLIPANSLKHAPPPRAVLRGACAGVGYGMIEPHEGSYEDGEIF